MTRSRYNDVRAVVLGLELNGLNVVRSLGRHRVQVVGIDSDIEQPSALSKYLLHRFRTPDIRGPAVIETLVELAKDGRRYALFPTMDATVHLLSEARDRLPENVIYRLPDRETVGRLLHKGSLRELFRAMDIPGPGYAVADRLEALDSAMESLRFPLVMKATLKKMDDAPKATILEDVNHAVKTYREQGEGEVILEEWIPGTDRDVYFSLLAFSGSGELLATFTGRKIRQWPPLVGGTASAEPVDLKDLEARAVRFFRQVGFKGICSMEYKFDARDGEYHAIEPTVGRTDFQSGIATANGVNIPFVVFADMAGTPVRTPRRTRPVKWRNPVGDYRSAMHYIERGELTRPDWKRSVAGPCVSTLFALDDPGPYVVDLFRRGLGRFRRRFMKGEAGP